MLVPVTADWLCAVQAGEVHAVHPDEVSATLTGRRRRRTFDTRCGLQRAGLLVVEVVDEHGAQPWDRMALPWPPPAKQDDQVRCRECWDATGNKRPHPGFKDLRRQETAA